MNLTDTLPLLWKTYGVVCWANDRLTDVERFLASWINVLSDGDWDAPEDAA